MYTTLNISLINKPFILVLFCLLFVWYIYVCDFENVLCIYVDILNWNCTIFLCSFSIVRVCVGQCNCVFAYLKSNIYVSGFENDYFLLYFNTKLCIVCLLIWSCILYFYLIQIPYVCEWLYECLFMNMCM